MLPRSWKTRISGAILDIVTGLRKEIQTLREQIDLFAEWG
jgi:hypothetical protein